MSDQPPAAARPQIGTFFQLGLSGLALGIGLAAAAGLVLLGFLSGRNGANTRIDQNAVIALAWAVAFLSILAIPSIYFSIRRLTGKPAPATIPTRNFLIASLAMILFPLALVMGSVSGSTAFQTYIIFPLAAIIAASLPIWWVVELARRDTNAGSPQRQWGTFNFALYISTPLVFILEMVGLILVIIAVVIWAGSDARAITFLQSLRQQALQSNGDIEAIRQLLLPVIRLPGVLFMIYTVIALLVPLTEELLKPLALFFLLGRNPSTAAGLALGAIAGAGFALPETLFNLAGAASNQQWLLLACGRIGTGLLHICTAALIGMAIASVWRSGRFYLLILAYAAAVGLHGLWNGLTITTGISALFLNNPIAGSIAAAATIGLLLLAIAFIGILYLLNRHLHANVKVPPLPEVESTLT
jgi:hypothetical protein